MKDDELLALLESCSYRVERLKAEELYAIGGDKLQDLRIVETLLSQVLAFSSP